MACLKMPEVNHVVIAGNLTKDPVVRKTSNGIPVINFCLASNHKYRDASNQWAEEVCYVGVVAWSKLADSCISKLRKGSAVLVDGELQSRTWHADDSGARTIVEIKAHRIQFLNKPEHSEDRQSSENGSHDFANDFPEASETEFANVGEEFEFAGVANSDDRSGMYAAGFDDGGAREIMSDDAHYGEIRTIDRVLELRLKPRNGEFS
jgi:single-strand DNA-binding protein